MCAQIEQNPRQGVELVLPHYPRLSPPAPLQVVIYAIAAAFVFGVGTALWWPA